MKKKICFPVLILGIFLYTFLFFGKCYADNKLVQTPGLLPIYDGEPDSFACTLSTGETLSGIGLNGSYGARFAPDGWHGPTIRLMAPAYRSNLMLYDTLEFYYKYELVDPSKPVSPGTQFIRLGHWIPSTMPPEKASSKILNINDYIQGRVIDGAYRKVTIPLKDFIDYTLPDDKRWELDGAETIYFSKDPKGAYFFLDNMALLDTTPISLKKELSIPETNKIITLSFSDYFDLDSSRIRSNYTLSSTQDPNYTTPKNPVDTGAHIRYQGHAEDAMISKPTNRYDLKLLFDKPLQEGKQYTLTVKNVKDLAGNPMPLDTFLFVYTDNTITKNIKINQEGYLPNRPNKIGYVGGYMGDLGGAVWAVGEQGKIFYRDKEHGWQEKASPVSTTLRAVAAIREDDAWAVGDGGVIIHFNGTSWNRVTSATTANLYAIDFDTKNIGWAVGANGTILRYDGSSWQPFSSPTTKTLRGVWSGKGYNTGVDWTWIIGEQGTIYSWKGDMWRQAVVKDASGNPITDDLYAITGEKYVSAYFIVGANGSILIAQYGGWKIAAASGGTTQTLRAVAINPHRIGFNAYVAGDNGLLWQLRREGTEYKVITSGITKTLYGAAFMQNREWWAVGSEGDVIKINNYPEVSFSVSKLPSTTTIYGLYALPFGPLRLPKSLPAVEIRRADNKATVLTCPLSLRAANFYLSGEDVYTFDFSALTTPGNYQAYLPGVGYSYPFRIGDDALDKTAYHTSRSLYYVRSGMPIETPFAEERFARGFSHTAAIDGAFHPSLAYSPLYNQEILYPADASEPKAPAKGSTPPPGSMIDVTGGWFDAGDYGKYMATAGPSVWRLLTAHDIAGQYFTDDYNLPESGNGIADILDEAKWEIDWVAKMVASDGGCYNKVVAEMWEGGTPDKSDIGGYPVRFIMEKTTQDTGTAAAILANASRVWKNINPQLSAQYLAKAKLAWNFLKLHPEMMPAGGFVNPPNHHSGPYPDPVDYDNRAWAAAELYRATGESEYRQAYETLWADDANKSDKLVTGWGWNEFQHAGEFAQWAYLRAGDDGRTVDSTIYNKIKENFKKAGDARYDKSQQNIYMASSRMDVPEWVSWGTIGQNTGDAYTSLLAWLLFHDQRYLDTAHLNADIVLGANPLGISFITGVGDVYPMDPLLGQSMKDNVAEPLPGTNVPGPFAHLSLANPWYAEGQSDKNNYPSILYTSEPYPILRRWADSRYMVGYNEGGICNDTVNLAVFQILKRIDQSGNHAPSAQPQIISLETNTNKNIILIATDIENDPLTYTIVTSPAHGALSGTAPNLIYRPNTDYTGSDAFAFKANDGKVDSNIATISITITGSTPPPANHPPVLTSIGNKTVDEGSLLRFTVSATDSDGDSLTYSASGLPSGATFSSTDTADYPSSSWYLKTSSTTKTFSWTPNSTQSGTYNVTFSVSDGNGGSDSETITITVNDVVAGNQPPVLNPIGNRSVKEKSLISFTVSATDPNGDTLTYSAAPLPTGATFSSSRIFRWSPTDTQSGTYDIAFSVSDGKGGSDSETITITVIDSGSTNQPPVLAAIGNKTVDEGSNLNFTISATDPNGDTLTYSASGLPSGASFNATTKTFSWTPSSTQSGTYNITFSVSDGKGGSDSEVVKITVSDAAVTNHAPVLSSIGNKSIKEGSLLSFTVSATDSDGDALTYSASGLPSGASFNNRIFRWSPNYSQGGVYNIAFGVSDGKGGSDSETIVITVIDVPTNNHAPVASLTAKPSSGKGIWDWNRLVFVLNVYLDASSSSDVDGDTLTYSWNFGDGTNATGKKVNHQFTRKGNARPTSYKVTLTVSDGKLTSSASKTVTVTR